MSGSIGAMAGSRILPRQLVVQPNGSLTWTQARLFLGWMCLFSFGIAGVFAAQGYWMVLPFAGLEMMALAFGLYVSLRASRYREVLSFDGPTVMVTAGAGKPEHSWAFPCHWLRIVLVPATAQNRRSRLLLQCSGEECEIGAFLTEAERGSLAERLETMLVEQKNWLLTEGYSGNNGKRNEQGDGSRLDANPGPCNVRES